MMNKLIVTLALMLQSACCMAQTVTSAEADKFLRQFEELITEMQNTKNPSEDQRTIWRDNYDEIRYQYKNAYHKAMTNDQVETYYKYVSQYGKLNSRKILKDTGEVIDSTANKVGKAVKRGAKKVSGTLKGIFNKEKTE